MQLNHHILEAGLAVIIGEQPCVVSLHGAPCIANARFTLPTCAASHNWLLDEITLAQKFEKAVKGEEFQVWKFAVKDRAATFTCKNGSERVVF